MSYVFRDYDRKSRRTKQQEPVIGIQRHGLLSLNEAAWELLGKATHVKLLYDENRKAFALRPAAPTDSNAYPVRKQGKSNSYAVTGRSFLTFAGVPFGKRVQRYNPIIEGELVIVVLEKEEEPSGDMTDREADDARDAANLGNSPLAEGGNET